MTLHPTDREQLEQLSAAFDRTESDAERSARERDAARDSLFRMVHDLRCRLVPWSAIAAPLARGSGIEEGSAPALESTYRARLAEWRKACGLKPCTRRGTRQTTIDKFT